MLIILLLISPGLLMAQLSFEFDHTISVKIGNQELSMPWAGGLNALQYNSMDINDDGEEDLIIYDRTSNKINVFIAGNTTYQYTSEYDYLLPTGINNWLIIRDYNCDGLHDIFTGSPFGIMTYLNIGTSSQPNWEIDENPLNTLGTSGIINLKINGDDLPAIEDIDGDGDLDILTFGFTGGGEVQFHQNMSIENNGDCSKLEYVRVTSKWGDFEECHCGEIVFGTEVCPPNGGREEHVAGKTLMAYDADNDGDFDLVVGEQECNSLILVINAGDNANAIMNEVLPFPIDEVFDSFNFPSAFLLDVNFDNKKDILISTNSSSNTQNTYNFAKSSWYYNNINNPSLLQENFLQDEMIDLGENAIPVFYDYDNDGDKDLLVGSSGQMSLSQISLFENIGSRQNPSFELIEIDYLGISSMNINRLKMQSADFDNNGIQDLILTGILEKAASPIIYLVKSHNLSNVSVVDFDLLSTDNSYFFDINNDGITDLLIGKSDGSLMYYKNTGTLAAPNFILIDDSFYGIGQSFTDRNLVATVGDADGNGIPDLITSDASGQISLYTDFQNHIASPLSGIKNILYNPVTEQIYNTRLGIFTWPTTVDLFDSGTPLIVIGSMQGGLQILKNTNAGIPGSNNDQGMVSIYPNPISAGIQNGVININSIKTVDIIIISAIGKTVLPKTTITEEGPLQISADSLESGVYLVLVYDESRKIETDRFVVIH